MIGSFTTQVARCLLMQFTVHDGQQLIESCVISFAHSWVGLSKPLHGVDLSYGLYLFHLPLPFGLHYAGIGGSYWYVLLSLVVAFALAAFSWFVVEKPALGLKRVNLRWRALKGPA